MLTVAAVPIYHLLVKPAKPADEKPPLRRGSSILEELTSAPLILRVVMWLQIFQGLLAWLAPKLFVAIYGVVEISRTDEMLCENWGCVWLALHAGALVGSRGGVSTAGIISVGLVLLLLGQLKSLFNEDFLGHTRGWVTVYSVVKLASLWGLEYGPALKTQDGLLAEAASKVIPGQAAIGWCLTLLVSADGLLMYFATDRYAAFWGYGPLDPISALCTISEGFSLVMVGAFWACLLRGVDLWKAYGVASIVYWLATVDATFISKSLLDVSEVGTEVDLVLSFVAVVATEAWTVFF